MTPAAPLPRPCVKDINPALQAREGDLPDVRLLGADYILYGVYQDWVNQNPEYHLDVGIEEDSKWQARQKKNCLHADPTLSSTFRESCEYICGNPICRNLQVL